MLVYRVDRLSRSVRGLRDGVEVVAVDRALMIKALLWAYHDLSGYIADGPCDQG